MDDLTRLALSAQQGDRGALAAFVRRTQPDVWRMCAYLVDPPSADDLTQDTYLRAYRALPRFRAQSSVRTWLLAIARRVCADAIRARQRSRRRFVSGAPPDRPTVGHAGAVEISLLLDAVDGDRREAFLLTQILGLSYAETAAVIGTPVGTVRSRVARARADLLRLLEDRPRALDGTAGV